MFVCTGDWINLLNSLGFSVVAVVAVVIVVSSHKQLKCSISSFGAWYKTRWKTVWEKGKVRRQRTKRESYKTKSQTEKHMI